MNIYNFLVSPDIAAFCEKIGHVFNPLEMAVIIALSEKPIKEKHAAWREIIADYPDMPIHATLHLNARDSLHDFLRELIEHEQKVIKEFLLPGAKFVYNFEVDTKADYSQSMGYYSTFQKAAEAANKELDSIKSFYRNNDKVYYVKISKNTIDTDKNISVSINSKCDIISILDLPYALHAGISLDSLRMIFFHLPVPFEKGDLVEYYDGEIGVLYDIPHWWGRALKYEKFVSGMRGDGSDMLARCFCICEDRRCPISDTFPSALHTLRYFKGELTGMDRFLKYLSQYIKNKDESIDWLINVFLKFKAEADLEKANGLFDGWYIDLNKENSE